MLRTLADTGGYTTYERVLYSLLPYKRLLSRCHRAIRAFQFNALFEGIDTEGFNTVVIAEALDGRRDHYGVSGQRESGTKAKGTEQHLC